MLLRSTTVFAAAAALLGACTDQSGESNDATANGAANAVTLPTLPVVAAPLDRAALLGAVTQAASAAAGGVDDGQAQRELDGRQFELRLRFGCSGPTELADEKALSWRFDEAKRTVRLRAAPDISLKEALPAEIAADAFEAIEGFWVPRPWLLQSGCPVVPKASAETAPKDGAPEPIAPETPSAAGEDPASALHLVGIAQFFSDTDSRTVRRGGRPYQATKALAEGQAPSAQGYDLVLSGRLKRLPGGRVIACRVEQADRPPQCLVSADFDRVWIERPDSRETIAEWNAGG